MLWLLDSNDFDPYHRIFLAYNMLCALQWMGIMKPLKCTQVYGKRETRGKRPSNICFRWSTFAHFMFIKLNGYRKWENYRYGGAQKKKVAIEFDTSGSGEANQKYKRSLMLIEIVEMELLSSLWFPLRIFCQTFAEPLSKNVSFDFDLSNHRFSFKVFQLGNSHTFSFVPIAPVNDGARGIIKCKGENVPNCYNKLSNC